MAVKDQVTHTGQQWDKDDVRSARFMEKTKQTNPRWAADLIQEMPVIKCKTRIVATTGHPNPALGHPKVFINLDSNEPVTCNYSGLRYQYVGDKEEVESIEKQLENAYKRIQC